MYIEVKWKERKIRGCLLSSLNVPRQTVANRGNGGKTNATAAARLNTRTVSGCRSFLLNQTAQPSVVWRATCEVW